MYENYHKHTHYSNIITSDSIAKPIDYLKRAVELNQKCYFTGEHGYQGNLFDTLDILEEFNSTLEDDKKIKMVVSAEAYYTKDSEEKDRTSYHIILVAKNNKGVEELNSLISYANIEGFYYKPRIDRKGIEKYLNPKNFICTTACIAGILAEWNKNKLDDLMWFKNFFKENLYLEVQSHINEKQLKHNTLMKKLSKEYNIKLIHANDSHYIYPEDAKYRDLYLLGKDTIYPEESGFILDYPTYDTLIERYLEQKIFTIDEIEEFIGNTLMFRDFEKITLYDKSIKMPQASENPKEDYKKLLNQGWIKHRNNVPKERWKEYLKAIRFEADIVDKTDMENYFLLNYKIIERAKEVSDVFITPTGRGSAGSFYTNKLLNLTGIDRLNSPVPLYPTRFISTERILKTKSLPDIDINVSDQQKLINAAYDVVGKENCGWMISYTYLKDKSAFRLWCKANKYNITEYNAIAKEIENYKDSPVWGDVIKDSERFLGVIDSVSPSPCSMLLNTTPVASHVGYIKLKDSICCNMTGSNCDRWKYLKDDFLQVKVLQIIKDTCEMANMPIPTLDELNNLLDEETFNIYSEGLTCTINQVDSDFATDLVSRYKPKNVAEVCAFVAALRPGFSSLRENFITRKSYTTGVKEIDDLLQDSFHYLLYQESIMKFLIKLNIKESESYDIIKKISKKKFKEQELEELKAKLKSGWNNVVGSGKEHEFDNVWQVVEDAANYSFNASHSISYAYDSLYVAYLKSHYPYEYYASALNLYTDDVDRASKLISELNYFDIEIKKPKFRKSKGKYFFDKAEKCIYKGIGSIKNLNEEIGNYLYSLKDGYYKDFIDLANNLKGHLNKKQIKILIALDFFSEFGNVRTLMNIYDTYCIYGDKTQLSKDKVSFPLDLLQKYSGKETKKTFKDVNVKDLILEFYSKQNLSAEDKNKVISWEFLYTGGIVKNNKFDRNDFVVFEMKTGYKYYLKVINIYDGKIYHYKANKGAIPVMKEGTVVKIKSIRPEFKRVYIDGEFKRSAREKDYFISEMKVLREPSIIKANEYNYN